MLEWLFFFFAVFLITHFFPRIKEIFQSEKRFINYENGSFANNNNLTSMRVAGVSYTNEDGSSRQEILKKTQQGDVVRLVEDYGNTHDETAIAVYTIHGQIGYIPKSLKGHFHHSNPSDFFCRVNSIGYSNNGFLGCRISIGKPVGRKDEKGFLDKKLGISFLQGGRVCFNKAAFDEMAGQIYTIFNRDDDLRVIHARLGEGVVEDVGKYFTIRYKDKTCLHDRDFFISKHISNSTLSISVSKGSENKYVKLYSHCLNCGKLETRNSLGLRFSSAAVDFSSDRFHSERYDEGWSLYDKMESYDIVERDGEEWYEPKDR